MKWLTKKNNSYLTMFRALVAVSFAAVVSMPLALADGAGNADVLPGSGCIQDVAGVNLGCTANDVNLGLVTNIMITDPCTVEPGDTVTFTGDFQMNLTAQARHDVGLYFASDGDGNADGALTGICTAVTPAYAPDPPYVDLDGTTDTFPGTNVVSNIQDTCGDIDANHNPLLQTITLTVMCVDDDGDGMLDLPYCSSWRQPGGNDLCTSPTDAFPGAPSKCKCDIGFSVDVPVPFTGTVEVIKDLDPDGDDGKFNLQIDGIDEFPDAMDMDSTGPVMVSAGTSSDPDPPGPFALHTVGETAGTDTSLGDYDSSITCSDGVDSVGPVAGAGPVELTVEGRPGGASDNWVCTITNTRRPATLTLVKEVINNNGGTAVATDFTLSAAGPTPISGDGGVGPSQVAVGTYTLSETNVTGYSASAWDCDGGTQNGDQITLESNDNVTCTITNDDNEPSLTLIKQVVNDNGGTAVPDDWTLTAAGYDPMNPAAGTFDLSESGPDGYELTSLTCDNSAGEVTSVTLGLGEQVTCTFVNDDISPTLTVIKTVINDNGGDAAPDDFNLTVDGGGVLSGVTNDFDAGAHTVSETLLAGYAAGDWGGDCAADGSITLALDQDATCTITNNDISPTLTVIKTVINNSGGMAAPDDFNLTVDGGSVLSGATNDFNAGAHTVAEALLAGYSAGPWGGDCAADGSITLALDQDATCTITNTDISPTLTVIKTVVNDNGGDAAPDDFNLTVDGGAVLSGTTNAFPAGGHTVSETLLPGYSAGDWGGDCAADGSITLALAQDATCTITNNDQPPKLTLIKAVNNGANPGGTAAATDWTLTATGPTGFSGQTGVMSDADFDQGSYDLSETGPAGYTASDWVCVGDGNQSDGDTISLGLGEEATCTITNTAQGMVDLFKLTNGVENLVMTWNFSLTGPGVDETDSSPPTMVDFGGVKLLPGSEYTLCETGIPAGWTLEWQVDTDGDGIPDTIIPMVAGVNNDPVGPDGYSRVYDPNYVAPPGQFTNDTRCVNFVVDVGETLAFQIDNQFPGGEPRTIGYWKNWNTCTNGNQPATAAGNGGPAAGWFILDDLLNNPGYTIGILQLDGSDCADAVNILDKRDIASGKKKASDAAYGLAAQLLAAQLNLSAGAETCMDVVTAVNAGQTLLASIDFDGTGNYLKGKNAAALRAEANALAATLDEYNNGNLCSP